MKQYPPTQIRNIAILGHSGSGKTSLAEVFLYNAKETDRLGRVADGNTVMDFDAEEIRRAVSINTAIASLDWEGIKINLLDTPGDFDFMGEVLEALRVADGALIAVSAKSGLAVGTEKSMRYCAARGIPFIFIINKMEEANADFYRVYQQLRDYRGKGVIPFMLPLLDEGRMTGFVDTLHHEAYQILPDGEAKAIPFPEALEEEVAQIHEQLKECVAETDDALLNKFFDGGEFTEEEYRNGLREALFSGSIQPVFCMSAHENWASRSVLTRLLRYLPSPAQKAPARATRPESDEVLALEAKADGPLAATVFKTMVDPFVGRISLFRVYSGTLKAGETLYNPQRGKEERVTGLCFLRGKKTLPTDSVSAGDIGALTKLTATMTGDSLCRKEDPYVLDGIDFPVPSFSMAILPTQKGEEDKILAGLLRLRDEDPTFQVENRAETHQMVISGLGVQHIDVLRAKLLSKYKVDSRLEEPRVPYRETIRKKVKVQGKHKKQSGGHGQYGDVWIEFEPGEEDGLTFEQKIFGGSVPKAYHPAVEKGLQEALEKGPLAGYPVVRLKATLLDGSYHDVDSSEMAFKIAAQLAYKAGLPQASPVLLEPLSEVKVYVPEAYMGDILSDLSTRRAQILGIEPKAEVQMIQAEVPSAEMASYAADLRSMTQGRGWYALRFSRYEAAPPAVQEKVIAEAQKEG